MLPPTLITYYWAGNYAVLKEHSPRKWVPYIFASNRNMIERSIDCLPLSGVKQLLEIGFGNGAHLPYLFAKASHLHYTGIERSEAMIAEANCT